MDRSETTSVDEPVDLYFSDALRLAGMDERFASILLESPAEFTRAFNLQPHEINALETAKDISEVPTVAQAG